MLIASYRGGGDQWDNPRYREAFAGLQVALAAWAWVAQRSRPDPWLRRALVAAGPILLWFLPWYLRRYVYLPWPVEDLFKTLGLGLASAVLLLDLGLGKVPKCGSKRIVAAAHSHSIVPGGLLVMS